MGFNIYDFSGMTHNMHLWFLERMSPAVTSVVEWTIIGVSYLLFIALFGLFLVYAERKVCAAFQQRLGPMRVNVSPLVSSFSSNCTNG